MLLTDYKIMGTLLTKKQLTPSLPMSNLYVNVQCIRTTETKILCLRTTTLLIVTVTLDLNSIKKIAVLYKQPVCEVSVFYSFNLKDSVQNNHKLLGANHKAGKQ